MAEGMKKARIVGNKIVSPDGIQICDAPDCSINDERAHASEYHAALEEYAPKRIVQYFREKGIKMVMDPYAEKMHEQALRVAALEESHRQEIWNEQQEAGAKVIRPDGSLDEVENEKYLAKRRQLEQLAEFTREK